MMNTSKLLALTLCSLGLFSAAGAAELSEPPVGPPAQTAPAPTLESPAPEAPLSETPAPSEPFVPPPSVPVIPAPGDRPVPYPNLNRDSRCWFIYCLYRDGYCFEGGRKFRPAEFVREKVGPQARLVRVIKLSPFGAYLKFCR